MPKTKGNIIKIRVLKTIGMDQQTSPPAGDETQPPRQMEEEPSSLLKRLQKELDEKTLLAEERLLELKYLGAEFDNYRKNFERERETLIKFANESLIRELLVIIDDFDRALRQMESEKDRRGITMAYGNFLKILECHGLRKIDAVGKKYDPEFHEAIGTQVVCSGGDCDDGIVLEELQMGFTIGPARVIRPAKVKISSRASAGTG